MCQIVQHHTGLGREIFHRYNECKAEYACGSLHRLSSAVFKFYFIGVYKCRKPSVAENPGSRAKLPIDVKLTDVWMAAGGVSRSAHFIEEHVWAAKYQNGNGFVADQGGYATIKYLDSYLFFCERDDGAAMRVGDLQMTVKFKRSAHALKHAPILKTYSPHRRHRVNAIIVDT